MEVTANMVQEGHQAIADTFMEKKMKARAVQSSAGTCNVDDWMQGLYEKASNGEVRRTSDACTQHAVGCSRQCQ